MSCNKCPWGLPITARSLFMLIYRLFTSQLTPTIKLLDAIGGAHDERAPVIIESTTWFLHIDESVPEEFRARHNCTIIARFDLLEPLWNPTRLACPHRAFMLLYKLLFLLPSTQIASDSFSLSICDSDFGCRWDMQKVCIRGIYWPNNLKRQRSSLILFTFLSFRAAQNFADIFIERNFIV